MAVVEAISLLKHEWLGRVPYAKSLEQMDEWQAARKAGTLADMFFYLEHDPVITCGRAAEPMDVRRSVHDIPVFEVPRGGKATYHGPGQLIGYGIIDLAQRVPGLRPDLEEYIRAIEQGLIDYLCEEHQLPAFARDGFTGVWIRDATPRKIASIGISARRWVSGHGFALNVATDLSAYNAIVPCGMPDVQMTSLAAELERRGAPATQLDLRGTSEKIHNHLTRALRRRGYLLPA